MKRLKLSSAVRPLADYVTDFADETVLLTQGKRAVAALVPLKNVDRESLALSQHPEFLELIGRARAEFSAGRTISLDEMQHRIFQKRTRNKRTPLATRKTRRGSRAKFVAVLGRVPDVEPETRDRVESPRTRRRRPTR